MKIWRLAFAMLAAISSLGATAQEEREYSISGFVPDGIEKVYLYKTEGLGSRVFLDSAIVADGKFTMKERQPTCIRPREPGKQGTAWYHVFRRRRTDDGGFRQ